MDVKPQAYRWHFLGAACLLSLTAALFGDDQPARPISPLDKMRSLLMASTNLVVHEQPLRDVLKLLSDQHGVSIRLDERNLKTAGISPELPVTISAKNYTLNAVLRLVLDEKGLEYRTEADGLVVTVSLEKPREVRTVELPAAVRELPERAQQARKPVRVNRLELDPQIRDLQNRYRASLRLELQFIAKVCHPDVDQTQKLEADGEQILTDLAGAGGQPRRPGNLANPPLAAGSIRQFRGRLHEAARTRLSPEQIELLNAELDAREHARIQSVVRTLVDRIDGVVILTPEQREFLSDNLASRSQDPWFPTPDAASTDFPVIPVDVLRIALNSAQMRLWQSAAGPNPRNGRGIDWMEYLQQNIPPEPAPEEKPPFKQGGSP